MTTNNNLSGAELAAALAEEVYQRNKNNFAVTAGDVGAVVATVLISSLRTTFAGL